MPATILDILGLETDVHFPGASLARFWQTPTPDSAQATDVLLSEITPGALITEWYPTFEGDLHSIVRGPYHYIKSASGKEELYDLDNDPFEENNLANEEGYRSLVAELRSSLDGIAPSS
jgi:arylsulfatase A-like enzyme